MRHANTVKAVKAIKITGLVLFCMGLLVLLASFSISDYQITDQTLTSLANHPSFAFDEERIAKLESLKGQLYESRLDFLSDVEERVNEEGALNDYELGEYQFWTLRYAITGVLQHHALLFFLLSIMLSCVGALLYFFPQLKEAPPGIKNDKIVNNSAMSRGWLGIAIGIFLIGFYILLYWYPVYIVNWIVLLDPVSQALRNLPADRWFFYGSLYTLAITVMGVRMLIKYRHSPYQVIRTCSVIFFQIGFAYVIPSVLERLNRPGFAFHNIWPLDYDFFFSYNLEALMASGKLGWFMLFWGVVVAFIAVPVLTYFFGKRWYCSWVCGCGGLAETLGDPFRQLSDKSLSAWKIERWAVHSVLVFAVVMTGWTLFGPEAWRIQQIYGFLIGAAFAGVVGVGFYPFMGSRVWCRFGCPLAAILGIGQKYKSRFRITTNGGQCISCGNCSTYCEMGIDVRWYAQRGQNIIRASCVGCGVCAAVCPRGVLNLENGPEEGRYNGPVLIDRDEVAVLTDDDWMQTA